MCFFFKLIAQVDKCMIKLYKLGSKNKARFCMVNDEIFGHLASNLHVSAMVTDFQ